MHPQQAQAHGQKGIQELVTGAVCVGSRWLSLNVSVVLAACTAQLNGLHNCIAQDVIDNRAPGIAPGRNADSGGIKAAGKKKKKHLELVQACHSTCG